MLLLLYRSSQGGVRIPANLCEKQIGTPKCVTFSVPPPPHCSLTLQPSTLLTTAPVNLMNAMPKYMYVACSRAVLLYVCSVWSSAESRTQTWFGYDSLVQCLLVSTAVLAHELALAFTLHARIHNAHVQVHVIYMPHTRSSRICSRETHIGTKDQIQGRRVGRRVGALKSGLSR